MASKVYQFVNREAVIRNMTTQYGRDPDMQALLGDLTTHELRVIAKHQDLMSEVLRISKIDFETAKLTLEERFGLEIEEFSNDYWVSTTRWEDEIPRELRTQHIGWYADREEGVVCVAKMLLLREVQVNLVMRYVEHKREQNRLLASAAAHGGWPGMYL